MTDSTMALMNAAQTYAAIPLINPAAYAPQLKETGWTVTGSNGTGAGVGGVLRIGAGMAGFTIQNGSAGPVCEVKGFYTEIGIGAGPDFETPINKALPAGDDLNSLVAEILKVNWKAVSSVNTDLGGVMPNKASPLYFWPKARQSLLTVEDFKDSDWLYINAGANLLGGADCGLLLLMQKEEKPKSFDDFFWSMNTRLFTIHNRILAWCLFSGGSLALGISVQAGVKSFTMNICETVITK